MMRTSTQYSDPCNSAANRCQDEENFQLNYSITISVEDEYTDSGNSAAHCC